MASLIDRHRDQILGVLSYFDRVVIRGTLPSVGHEPYQWYHQVRSITMPTSTITSKGQTTVPKEVREALDVGPGDKITWEINGGRVSVSTERPAFWRWEGFIKHGPTDVVKAVHEARKRRGRI